MASLSGQVVSHYRVLEKVGEGGMGVVYKSKDTKLDRLVALKFLPPELTRDPETRGRFVQEAKAASALQHANICVVHDIDETPEGQIFISMEYLEGETLRKRIERGPLKLEQAVDVATQLAQGLAKAHQHGIVHRDIKPANVMLTTDGVAKIVDFGLAKLSERSVQTKAGTTLGTAAYMSPEQARGDPTDHRADIWSLGVVLYEMIAGRAPFRGDYENAVVYSILNSTPEPLSALRTGVPKELENVVEKCLSKAPADRYQHMDDLLVDLRSSSKVASRAVSHPQEVVAPIRRKKLFWYGALASAVVLALVAYFGLFRGEPAEVRIKKIAVLPFENLGTPEDEYFADGLTDEITSRLSAIRTLGVISRTSSMQYKKTSKTLPVVAKELGVDYVLEGTIRWVKTGGSQRIRITPQLIKVSGDVHLWADNIDRTLDDIFSVQTEIATRVVSSLDLVLVESEKQAIEAIPTKDLEAYQAYLRGSSFLHRGERGNVNLAIETFGRAVRLDTTFALAYARLAFAHLYYFWLGYERTAERLATAKEYLDRAFAIDGGLPEANLTLGYYYYYGFRDYERALAAFAQAEKALPNSREVLSAVAYAWRRQGKFEEAAERLKKSLELDPQSADLALELGNTLWALGRYADGEAYLDRSISLLPDQESAFGWKSEMYLVWRGDTKKARAELERIPEKYQPWLAMMRLDVYERNYDAALRRLDQAPEGVSVDQQWIFPVSQLRGMVYRLMNDGARSRASFDTARIFLESELKTRPDDYRLRQSLGLVYAGLGRADDAVREAKSAVKLLPLSADALFGFRPRIFLAQVYIMVGKYDEALDELEYLESLRAPTYVTAPVLQMDPVYDPLRGNPRFQALLAKGERSP